MHRALLIGCCLLVPGLSLAAQAPTPKPQEIVIDPDGVIVGEVAACDSSELFAKRAAHFKSLIQLRDNFADKVTASASEL